MSLLKSRFQKKILQYTHDLDIWQYHIHRGLEPGIRTKDDPTPGLELGTKGDPAPGLHPGFEPMT